MHQRRSQVLRFIRWFINGSNLGRNPHPTAHSMRSHLIKKNLSGLPRTNQHLIHRPRPRLHRFRSSPAVQAFFVILLASLGLSLIYSEFRRLWYYRHSTAANSVLPHFTSRLPLVDRTIFEKIARLDLEDEMDSESGSDFSIPINIDSSDVFSPFFRPRVTHIPEVQPQVTPNLDMETTQNNFCSEGSPDPLASSCKFLLPLKIPEQGANAHTHLVRLLGLARALNRTLVLPNVGKNKVGACRRWRFGVYYDERALLSELGGDSSSVVRQDGFKAWIDSLSSPPSSQLVSLKWVYNKNFPPVTVSGQYDGGLDVYIHDDPDTAMVLSDQTGCLNRRFPRLDPIGSFPPSSFVVTDHSKQERIGGVSRTLLDGLSGPALTRTQSEPRMKIDDRSTNYDFYRPYESPDVLIVSWNVPSPIFQPRPTTIFSPQLRALAARMIRRLGPYIAVTWDVETSKSDAVLGCVEALRSTIHYVLSGHEQLGIRNVWLVGNLSPSDLLHSSEPLCPSTFTRESFFTSGVKLTRVHQELERMVNEGEEVDDVAGGGDDAVRKQEVLKDAGVLRILDKLVSMRSTYLVIASKSCGKTRCALLPPAVEYRLDLSNRP